MTSPVDSAAFTLPPKVARMDAVRKLAARLTEVTGLGETGALTLAEAAVDPAAVRAALTRTLPGLTARKDAHLQIIPTRVWTPWTTPPADEMLRYGSKKRFPVGDPQVPPTPTPVETVDGISLEWPNPADRAWHLKDNEDLYGQDVYRDSLRLFPERGGIVHPLVLMPQTETFADGSETLASLRIVDGNYRYYGVTDLLRRYAALDPDGLAGHLGADITPEIFQAALERDRPALLKVINAVREACAKAGDGQHVGVHYLATALSLPAHVVVGTVEPNTGRVRPLGSEQDHHLTASGVTHHAMLQWHSGSPARVVATGQQTYNGLLLPEATVDTELIETATKRLRVRGVPKEAIFFGEGPTDVRTAARFVWWCRAIRQLGGTPATAAAAFALHTEPHDTPWPQSISGPLLACATHIMEEDFGSVVFPPGDYRDPETLPDSLSLLTADARNLTAVAALSSDGRGGHLAHPRFLNAAHIALAHLAFIGALPAKDPLPDRITGHAQLLSHIATAWASTQTAHFVRADGTLYRDADDRPVPIDERTLNRDDLPWPTEPTRPVPLTPPSGPRPYGATHIFRLKHGVTYTIPAEPFDKSALTADPEALAAVVRRWFPDATGIVLTDWSDKFITGVMVGSVFVRLFDRQGEREDARSRGVWYPGGQPTDAKDVVDFEGADSGAPVGELLDAGNWIGYPNAGAVTDADAVERWYEELDEMIIQEADDALEAQKAADDKKGHPVDVRWDVPVLRLPKPAKGER